MTKYINAEKLKAEIERLKAVLSDPLMKINGADYITGGNKIAKEILSFIDSLQQEQPEVDLEKEIKNYTESLYHELFVCQHTVDEFDWEDIAETIDMSARYFFEFGLKAGKE